MGLYGRLKDGAQNELHEKCRFKAVLLSCKGLFVYWLNILSMPFPTAHKHVSRQYQNWFLINHTSRASLPLGAFWGLFTLYTPDQTKRIYFVIYIYIYVSLNIINSCDVCNRKYPWCINAYKQVTSAHSEESPDSTGLQGHFSFLN